jgi:hypothetical protein
LLWLRSAWRPLNCIHHSKPSDPASTEQPRPRKKCSNCIPRLAGQSACTQLSSQDHFRLPLYRILSFTKARPRIPPSTSSAPDLASRHPQDIFVGNASHKC